MRESSGRKGKVKVVTSKQLVGCVEDLFLRHPLQVSLNLKEVVERLKRPVSDTTVQRFNFVAADTGGPLVFENRELLCRFALLKIDEQKAVLAAIRAAMHDNQVMDAEFGFSLSTARSIRVRMDSSGSERVLGQGTLIFYW